MKKLILASALALSTLSLSACGSNDAAQSIDQANAACQYENAKSAAKDVKKPSGDTMTGMVDIQFVTSAGDINLKLNADQAPCTVGAISSLVEQGYYDDTVCHRLTTEGIFVLQCGDPSGTGSGGPGFSFKDEYPVGTGASGLYEAGTVAMANAGPNTNGSQFFLNYQDSPLPSNYTLFGEMDEASLQVVRDIATKGTASGSSDGKPAEEVRITKASLK